MEKKVQYICRYCKNYEIRNLSEGEPESGQCPYNPNGTHVWITASEWKKKIQYICRFCGEELSHRKCMGVPDPGKCLRNDEASHEWVEKCSITEIEYLTIKANCGDLKAIHNLGDMYTHGKEQDISKAIEWYKKAADKGDCQAMISLAKIYEDGNGIEQNIEEAMIWYKKAADKGDCQAMISLAKIYEDGNGIERNIEEAMIWYKKASQENLKAEINAMNLYTEPDRRNASKLFKFPIDGPRVLNFYRVPSETIIKYTQAGFAYEYGIETEQDKTKAVESYSKAAALGGGYAMFALGNAYENGEGVPQDKEQALKMYKRASKIRICIPIIIQ